MQGCFDLEIVGVRCWIAFLTIWALGMPLKGQSPVAQRENLPHPQCRAEQRIPVDTSFEALIHHGQTLQAEGQYSAAKSIFLLALKNAEGRDPNSVETAFALDNLASIVAEEGNFSEAQNLYARALRNLEKQLVIGNETSVRVMIHLAGVYAQTGPVF
jgi:tetratricopeptide (TPR) repeat protein